MSEPSPLPIPAASLPAHIAIIMDGNGRWAQERGLSRSEGHKAGVRAAKAIVTECRTLGIRHLTLYTFSQENWGRPKDEVSLLFQLLVSFLGEELPSMERNGISLRVFGELSFEKIGSIFGKSAGWARVTYYRAKQQIAQYMEVMDDEK